jgi:hypothetical protein
MVQKTYYKTKDYCKVKFSFAAENVKSIKILGLNGDWKKAVIMTQKKDGSFSADVNLPKASQHQFKYLVDGSKWLNEPQADSEIANEFGGTNSLLVL